MFQKKQNKEENIFLNVPTVADKILPDVIKENSDYLYLGYNKYARYFVMTIYPEQTYIGWLQDISYIPNINISIKIVPSQNSIVINQLTRKLVQAQSEYTISLRQGNISHTPELERTINDLEELRMLIQTNQDKLYFVSIFISLTCESLEELNNTTKILQENINKKTALTRTLTFRQLEGLEQMIPVATPPISNYDRNFVSGGISTLIPVSNANVSHDKGVYLGRNYYTNNPVYLDSFIGPPSLPNPHIFICGTSGAGKSVALKALSERNIITNGSSAFFIDVEGEYSGLVKKLGGKVIKIKQGQASGINPFEIEKDFNGKKEFLNIKDKVSEIVALISTIMRNYMNRKLSGTELAEIEIVVNELYRERGITEDINSLFEKNGGRLNNGNYVIGKIRKQMPTLTDFQVKLKKRNKCNELSEILIPFLKDNSKGIFDCESTINENTDIISFDISDVKDEFTKLYSSFVVLSWIWQKFILKNKKKKKLIVCDEGWLFLKYKESANFLANVARRRKKI